MATLIKRTNGMIQYTPDGVTWYSYDPSHPAALQDSIAAQYSTLPLSPGEYTSGPGGTWVPSTALTGGDVTGGPPPSGIGPGAGGVQVPTMGIDWATLQAQTAYNTATLAENKRQFDAAQAANAAASAAELAFNQQQLAQQQGQFQAGLAFDQQRLAQDATLTREGFAQQQALAQMDNAARMQIAQMQDATNRWLQQQESALARELQEKDAQLRLQLQNNEITLQKYLQEREIANQQFLQERDLAQREAEFARNHVLNQLRLDLDTRRQEFDEQLAAATLRANPRDWVANAYFQRSLTPEQAPLLGGQTPATDEMLANMPWLAAIQANRPLPAFQAAAGQVYAPGESGNQPFGIPTIQASQISAPVANSLSRVERDMLSGAVAAQGQDPLDFWERASKSWITGTAEPGSIQVAA